MLYDLSLFIFSLLYLPALIFKGKLRGDFSERFAIFDKTKEISLLSGKDRIWIQAVSVGEVALCKNLIPLLKKRFPSHGIIISTITKTGNDLAKKIFSKDATIIYFPLDFSFIVKKAVKIIQPKLYIMIETEIWPNLLRKLSSILVPSILINGRISDSSIGRYRLAKPFLKNVLDKISVFCMQDSIDAERIIELGAPADRVRVTGNMKFDAEIATNIKGPAIIRESLGLREGDELLVAGSTHSGEEEIIIGAFKELSEEFLNLKLLIAPRHIDRIYDVEKSIQRAGFESLRFSKLSEHANTRTRERARSEAEPPRRGQIIILDTIGHLNDAYSAAALVFIGGSLVRHGGHNPIEPAVLERAILFGPYMFNFKYIAKVFLNNNAAIEVFSKKDFVEKCKELLKSEDKRNMLGRNAKRVILENRGATEKNIEAISEIFR